MTSYDRGNGENNLSRCEKRWDEIATDMARKIEKMKRVETRRVEIFTLNRETNDEVINFDFDSGIGSER